MKANAFAAIAGTVLLLFIYSTGRAEFIVDENSAPGHFTARICQDALGRSVVAWYDSGATLARLLDAGGTPLGHEIELAPVGGPFITDLACADDGSFVVTSANPSPSTDMFAQLFDATGAPRGPYFQINVAPGGGANVCSDAAGNFVVVWEMPEQGNNPSRIYARRFDSTGMALGPEFLVDTTTAPNASAGGAVSPDLACDPNGNFVVAWTFWHLGNFTMFGQETDFDVYGQRFDNTGAPQGGEFLIQSLGPLAQNNQIALCRAGAGNFVVTFYGSGTDRVDLFAQRYDAAGTPVGSAIQVNQDAAQVGVNNDVACDDAGGFIVAWDTGAGCGNTPPFMLARRYDASGSPLGGEFNVEECDRGGGGPSISSRFANQWRLAFAGFFDTFVRLPTEKIPAPCHIGNGKVDCGEACDDGNRVSCDGCGACKTERATNATLPPGGSVSSDGGSGTTVANPVATNVTTPSGGGVSILETGESPAAGYAALSRAVVITAPMETAANPLVFTFQYDSSIIPAGVDASNITLLRNGLPLADCTGAPMAVPDPCISSRLSIPSGIQLTALTSAASTWTAGTPLCSATPRTNCLTAPKTSLSLVDNDNNAKDSLVFKWLTGETNVADFGDPTRTASYAACVYDNTGLVASTTLAPGGMCGKRRCWKSLAHAKGYSGKNIPTGGHVTAVLKGGEAGLAKTVVTGKGSAVTTSTPPFTPPVTVQVVNSDTGFCWGDEYEGTEIVVNSAAVGRHPARFTAKVSP